MLKHFLILIAISLSCMSCDFNSLIPGVDEKFGEQHFKSAIAVIELHKTRTGEYPNSLEDLEHLGDWDLIWVSSVRYERTGNGYNLYIEKGWTSEPDLALPKSYRQGLGLEKSNVKWNE